MPDRSLNGVPWVSAPFLISQRGDHFFRFMKTNPQGTLDTSFRFKTDPLSIAEPDTNHLYVAGNFLLYGSEIAPYLVRIHNKTSVVVLSRTERKNSQVSLYPNPAGEEIHLNGWKPGMRLTITSIEGRKLFEGPVEKDFATAKLGLKPGVYFWTATLNENIQGGGRLIR